MVGVFFESNKLLIINRYIFIITIITRFISLMSVIIFLVAPEMTESQMMHVNPSQVISFDLDKKDIFRYVHR